MTFHVDHLRSTVEAAPEPGEGAAPAPAPADPDQKARLYREMRASVERDLRRTRAEGYSD
ncbi:hypothetical protein [Sorangium sp. So ce854]|uniref:hypothetical protein n=1 Tax=Sorangium sp. So ce854 TaxID=3133322 RepID=UPI003F604D52